MAEKVLVERQAGVLIVTLNRPSVRNAIDSETAHALDRAADHLEAEPQLTVGVLTGAGGTFCAGMDLKAYARGERAVVANRGFAGLTERVLGKPLIAAVEGWALGGGCEIALACDMVVAARGARFGIPEVRRGLIAAGGGLIRLPRRIPSAVAKAMALTGDPLQAADAYRLGMVNELTQDGSALDTALELAERIGRNAPLAVRASKRIIDEFQDRTLAEAFDLSEPIARAVEASDDAVEGTQAFAGKRTPRWQGR